jgi:hypothetical protein
VQQTTKRNTQHPGDTMKNKLKTGLFVYEAAVLAAYMVLRPIGQEVANAVRRHSEKRA